MPAIQPGSKVLVTGANGYIANWLVQNLLERGFAVRGTVRTPAKGEYLKDKFAAFGDKFELVYVKDITAEGAFDEAVKGVDAIEHTASPFHTNADDPQELIKPAVQGTIGILESARKFGTSVKRIVVTSSSVAIMTPPTKPTIFSEKDWNEESPKEIERLGKDAAAWHKYRASKTLAEKAAWDFYNKYKSEVSWDITVLNPPFVFGPAIHDVSKLEDLNTSLKQWYDVVVADTPKSRDSLASSTTWVDVRDVAEAHARVLEKEAAGGERIMITSGPYIWQEWLDTANSLSPQPYTKHMLPAGEPGIEKVYMIDYDTTKEKTILGIKFKTLEESARDMLEYFVSKGW
ncbi:hypothetical protein BDQ17DRAFT_1410630 [Cyathus striatus]|nr:hypothetical protein BDQ17DRAFT_1410630 [Cyathus striatus]